MQSTCLQWHSSNKIWFKITSTKAPETIELVCLSAPWGTTSIEVGISRCGAWFFWNEKASHVSSASHIEDVFDVTVEGNTILLWCLDIWAAMAASNESQLNGISWRQWLLWAVSASMQLGSTLWGTSDSKSPTLMLVRLSAHSPADDAMPLHSFWSP